MITTSTKYAVNAMIYLGKHPEDFVSIDTLAAELEIPRPYLAKIMKTLAAKHLVDSKKGLWGGFRAKELPHALTLYDICIALDDPAARQTCFLGRATCGEQGGCIFHPRWGAMRERLINFLRESEIVPKTAKTKKRAVKRARREK